MNDALLMRGIERFGHIERNLQGAVEVHGMAVENLEERVPFHELHGNVGTAGVLTDLVDRANVGVVESGSGAGLASEAFQRGGVFAQLVGQKFECHETAKIDVLGLVDEPHAPTAEQLNDAVMRDDRVDHWWD